MAEQEVSLIIWMQNGESLLFTKVENFSDSRGQLKFDYFGTSTQTARSAVFDPSNIAGYALSK